MKKTLLVLAISTFIFIVMTNVTSPFFYGTISKSTGEKYLRNIDKMVVLNANQLHTNNGGDSLSYIAITAFSQIDIFCKYYIANVGGIPRRSKLSHAVDSIFESQSNPEIEKINKLK